MGAECSRNESSNPYGIPYPVERPFCPPPKYPPIILPPFRPGQIIWHN